MTTNESTHPDTARLQAAREAARPEHPRLAKLLGGAACLVALAAGVAAGLMLRSASADAAALAPRRAAVASLSASEKDHLRRQYTRFMALSAEQQEHLRSFDEELAEADDAQALRGTLRRYNDWLRTISPAERGELLKLAGQPAHRAQRVEQLSPLSRPDAAAVEKWLKACVKARVKNGPFRDLRDESLLIWGQGLLFERSFGGRDSSRPATKRPFGALPSLEEADFAKLSTDLSELRREELDREKSAVDKRRLVSTWWQRRRNPGEPRVGPASADELVRFYSEDLTDEARGRLLALPPEQRNRELREEYRKAKAAEGFKRPPQPSDGT